MFSRGNPSDYKCTQEHNNYARLCRALVDLCGQVLRDFLTKNIPSNELLQRVRRCSKLRLNPSQQGIINSVTLSDYNDFDISLLYILIRNLCPTISPTRGWGHHTPPTDTDVTEGDDLERIHFIRNYLFAHIATASISDIVFRQYWLILQDLLGRMEGRLEKEYCQILSLIKTDNMDEANAEKCMEAIKEMKESERELRSELDELKANVDGILGDNDPIPKNIKALHKKAIKRWTEEDEVFVNTRATDTVREAVKSRDFVAVSGAPGSGKSVMIRHLAMELEKEGYRIVPVDAAKEIIKYWSPDIKQVFVHDDPFGVHSFKETEYDNWTIRVDKLKDCLKDNKLLISMRNYFEHENRVSKLLKQFNYELINICDNQLKLNSLEQTNIFKIHMLKNKKNIASIPSSDLSFFPLLCCMYASDKESKFEIKSFFEKPLQVMHNDLQSLRENDHCKYFCLVLCLVYDGVLSEDLFHVSKGLKDDQVIRETFLDLCLLSKYTPTSEIKNSLDSLVGTYLIKDGKMYSFLHDVVFDAVISSLTPEFHEFLLEFCSSSFFHFKVFFPEMLDGRIESISTDICPFIVLNENHHKAWGDRLVNDLKGGKFSVLFISNPCFEMQKSEEIFLESLRCKIEENDIVDLINSNRINTHQDSVSSTFEISILLKLFGLFPVNLDIFLKDFHPLHFLIEKQFESTFTYLWDTITCSFKQTLITSGSLLCSAARVGSCDILRCLIKSGSDINKNNEFSCFPLLYASANGHRHIVDILIKEGADVNMCLPLATFSPLSTASLNGHTDVVEMLIDRGANVNFIDAFNQTPLSDASENGHIEIVQKLISNGAIVNFFHKEGFSPLVLACKNGHDKVAKILIDNCAKLKKYNRTKAQGSIELLLASRGGHDKVVKLLIDNGADINLCKLVEFIPMLSKEDDIPDCVNEAFFKRGINLYLHNTSNLSPLLFASCNGHEKVVKLLVNAGAEVNLCDSLHVSPLVLACRFGHDQVVKILLNNGAQVDMCDSSNRSPLFWASCNGHEKVVKLLTDRETALNICDRAHSSPLLAASRNGHLGTVQLLIEKGADISIKDNSCSSPLLWASKNGHDKVVQVLADKGADVNSCDHEKSSPVFWSSRLGHEKVVEILVDKGANVNSPDRSKSTPVLWASRNGHDKVVQLLVDNGGTVDMCEIVEPMSFNQCFENEYVYNIDKFEDDVGQVSPLLLASCNGHERVVQILINAGADVNLCNNFKVSPLTLASRFGHYGVVKLLLDNGAQVDIYDSDNWSPLFWASFYGHDTTMRLLIDRGAKINVCDEEHVSPLLMATKNGHVDALWLLLEKGADFTVLDDQMSSPIMWASRNGHANLVQTLVEKGAVVNACDDTKSTPVLWASCEGHDKVVQILAKHGADVNICDETKSSPILWASRIGHEEVVKILVQKGANVNLVNSKQCSPLLWSSRNGHENIVKILIDKGADVNQCNKKGETALLWAAYNGHDKVVKILVENGANVHICDKRHASPLLLASDQGYYNVVALLLRKGADRDVCNYKQMTPLSRALRNGDDRMAELLKVYNVK